MLMLKRVPRQDSVEMWIPMEDIPGLDRFVIHGTIPGLALEVIQKRGANAEFRAAAAGLFRLFRLQGDGQSEPSPWNFANGFRSYETPGDFLEHMEILSRDRTQWPTERDPDSTRVLGVFLPLADFIPTLDQMVPGKNRLVRFRPGLTHEAHIRYLPGRPVWS